MTQVFPTVDSEFIVRYINPNGKGDERQPLSCDLFHGAFTLLRLVLLSACPWSKSETVMSAPAARADCCEGAKLLALEHSDCCLCHAPLSDEITCFHKDAIGATGEGTRQASLNC